MLYSWTMKELKYPKRDLRRNLPASVVSVPGNRDTSRCVAIRLRLANPPKYNKYTLKAEVVKNKLLVYGKLIWQHSGRVWFILMVLLPLLVRLTPSVSAMCSTERSAMCSRERSAMCFRERNALCCIYSDLLHLCLSAWNILCLYKCLCIYIQFS